MKHVQTGMCINDTRIIQSEGTWGNVSFVGLSNNCLDPAAQFRFRDNGAMLNLKRPGCLFPTHRAGSGYGLDMFYLYINRKGLDTEACSERVDRNTDPAITQTSWGGLSVKYRKIGKTTVQTTCAVPNTDSRLQIATYVGLTTSCGDAGNKRFNFGKFLLAASLKQYNHKMLTTQHSYITKRHLTNYFILMGPVAQNWIRINFELHYHHV